MSKTRTELTLHDNGALELTTYVKGIPNIVGHHEVGTYHLTVVFYDDDEASVIDHRDIMWEPHTFPAEKLQDICKSMTVDMMKEMIGC